MLQSALEVIQDELEELADGDQDLYNFSVALTNYVNQTWIHGQYSVQDWNLFDVG